MPQYQVTEIEGVRIHEGTPEQFHIGVTQATIERIFKLSSCPSDALALYVFYAYTSKWQKNTSAYANQKYAMKKLNIGRDRFAAAKKSLKELGLITDERRVDENNRATRWFVRVNYALSTTTEIHLVGSPLGGKPTTVTIYSQGETSNLQIETKKEDLIENQNSMSEKWEELRKMLSSD